LFLEAAQPQRIVTCSWSQERCRTL